MSDSQVYEEETVASDGVTVTKRYEADEFPVPAIAFNFESRRSEPVTIELSDVVPEDVAVEDLGFHPEYGSEYWTIDDDEISFRREIEPESEYTTVYGIRATGTDNVEQFLTEPTIDQIDPPLEDDEEALVGEGSDAVKDVIAGDADSVPGLDDVDDEEIETLDLKDPNNAAGAAGSRQAAESSEGAATTADGEETSEESAAASSAGDSADDGETGDAQDDSDVDDVVSVERTTDSVVAAMATEIRNQNVSKEDVKLLRKAFDLAEEKDGAVEARVQKLQSDVTDVIAYTEALEEFLDENGTADQLIEDFRTEVEQFRDQVESFEADLESVEGTVADNETAIGSLSDDVATVEGSVDEMERSVSDVQETVESLETGMEDLREELETVREDVGDGDVEERIDEVDQEIEELKEWREQLSSVIGGGD